MFFDIHAHVYKYPYPHDQTHDLFLTEKQLRAVHDRFSIKQAALLPIVSPEVYVPQSVGEVIEIAKNSNDRFVPFCNLDPRVLTNTSDAPLGNLLTFYKEQGCVGLGEVMPNMDFNDPKMLNLMKHAQSVGFPFLFDITGNKNTDYGLYDQPGLYQLEFCLEKFPNLIFIGHGPAFWAEISTLKKTEDRLGYPQYPVIKPGRVPKLMATYPNLFVDLSANSGANAMLRDQDHALSFIHAHQDRIFFGSDLCHVGQIPLMCDFLIQQKNKGTLSKKVFEKIAYQNAIKQLIKHT